MPSCHLPGVFNSQDGWWITTCDDVLYDSSSVSRIASLSMDEKIIENVIFCPR